MRHPLPRPLKRPASVVAGASVVGVLSALAVAVGVAPSHATVSDTTITGSVVGPNGSPVNGARVIVGTPVENGYVSEIDYYDYEGASSGDFSLQVPDDSGPVVLMVDSYDSSPDYPTQYYAVRAPGQTTGTLASASRIDPSSGDVDVDQIQLQSGGGFAGAVTSTQNYLDYDAVDSSGTTVGSDEAYGRPNTRRFSMSALFAGSYTLRFAGDSGQTAYPSQYLGGVLATKGTSTARFFNVTNGATTALGTVGLAQGVRLSGKLVDSSGHPMTGCILRAYHSASYLSSTALPTRSSGRIPASGVFAIDGLTPGGTYVLATNGSHKCAGPQEFFAGTAKLTPTRAHAKVLTISTSASVGTIKAPGTYQTALWTEAPSIYPEGKLKAGTRLELDPGVVKVGGSHPDWLSVQFQLIRDGKLVGGKLRASDEVGHYTLTHADVGHTIAFRQYGVPDGGYATHHDTKPLKIG